MRKPRVIGVVVVDDHEIAREGVRSRLELETDFEVLAELPSADDLIPTCEQHQPQVVLMDIDMPGSDPFTMIQDLKRLQPDVRVLILSAYVRDGYVDAAVQAGAWGYLSKNQSFDDIVRSVRRVVAGELAYPPEILDRFEYSHGQLRRRDDASCNPISTLTPRELEVMRLIAKGLSTKEIAGILHRSPKTIDAHRTSLMRKLSIDDRVELTRYAIREGIVEP
ncbi:MAG: DNA-binding response regulator [Planctomycetes bacterium]|nr:DNA-binding response regulator [Planctomycetota bacterium]NOG56048.1 response regulator transcription factor [Planctomycetota bacterium]